MGTVVLSSFVDRLSVFTVARTTAPRKQGSGLAQRRHLSAHQGDPEPRPPGTCRNRSGGPHVQGVATRLRVPLGAAKPGACRLEAGRRFPLNGV